MKLALERCQQSVAQLCAIHHLIPADHVNIAQDSYVSILQALSSDLNVIEDMAAVTSVE